MKLACVYSNSIKAKILFEHLSKIYTFFEPKEADIIICLGGDGFLLHTMHEFLELNIPIYGINCGSVGFLLNIYNETENLIDLINNAKKIDIYPLLATFKDSTGNINKSFAFNEVSVIRNKSTTSHLSISIDNIERMEKLIGDGVLVSTPSGSTSYNRACGGSLISINSNLLVLTPINPFHPLGWKGATLNNQHIIDIKILDTENRSVNICCDFKEYINITDINIKLENNKKITLLFNKNNDLESKILETQFKTF